MTRKKHKRIVADDTDLSKHAAYSQYGKQSGKIPAEAREELGRKA